MGGDDAVSNIHKTRLSLSLPTLLTPSPTVLQIRSEGYSLERTLISAFKLCFNRLESPEWLLGL